MAIWFFVWLQDFTSLSEWSSPWIALILRVIICSIYGFIEKLVLSSIFSFAESLKRQEIKLLSTKANISLLFIKVYHHRSLTTATAVYNADCMSNNMLCLYFKMTVWCRSLLGRLFKIQTSKILNNLTVVHCKMYWQFFILNLEAEAIYLFGPFLKHAFYVQCVLFGTTYHISLFQQSLPTKCVGM